MAWIEVHQALRDHRKVLALAERLDMPEPHVAGHLIYLWLWALDNAPDGVLPASTRSIERAAGWVGAPGTFVAAAWLSGFLDEMADGSYHIHDWDDYAGKIVDRRERNKMAMRAARARDVATPPAPVDNTLHTREQHVAKHVGLPYPTVPYHTVPERERARARADDTPTSLSSHNEPLSLSLEISQGTPEPEPEAAASTPVADPVATRDTGQALFMAWSAAVGYTPKTAGERRSWVKALLELKRDTGLSPPECAALVAQYRAMRGDDKRPTPGQVAGCYSQLAVRSDLNGHANGSYHPAIASASEQAAKAQRDAAQTQARHAGIAALAAQLAAG